MPATNRKRKVVKRKKQPLIVGMPNLTKSWPFPLVKYANIAYADTFVLSSGTLQLFGVEQTIILNGLWDVDFSGVGHQPLGFDQLMAIYGKYKVMSVKVELDWYDPNTEGLMVGFKVNSPGDGSALGGMSYQKAKELLDTNLKPLAQTGSQHIKQTFKAPAHVFLGVTKQQFNTNVENYTGDGSSNPIRGSTLRFALINPHSAINGFINCSMKVSFRAQFYERKTLPQS